jgi:hypothetical protein
MCSHGDVVCVSVGVCVCMCVREFRRVVCARVSECAHTWKCMCVRVRVCVR